MTLHTKAATDDILDIFNQPLRNVDPMAGENDSEGETDCDDEDDYTSAGESTGTGKISGISDFGDTEPYIKIDGSDVETAAESVSPWSDFTASKHVPKYKDQETESSTKSSTGDEFQLVKKDAPIDLPDNKVDGPTGASPKDQTEGHITKYVPIPPEDYEPPTHYHRDPAAMAQSRLPFMTPIIEKTETSLSAFSVHPDKDDLNVQTPSRYVPSTHVTPLFEGEPLSSPLQEIVNESKPSGNPRPDDSKASRPHIPASRNKLPIINDVQCNPVDESVRKAILTKSNSPLSFSSRYHNQSEQKFGKAAEIRKFIKSVSKVKSSERTTASIILPPILHFGGEPTATYTIRRELGKGAFAPVYLAEQTSSTNPEESASLVAIKSEDPPTEWEFYIMTILHARLNPDHRVSSSLLRPYSFHLFKDEGYLVEEYRDQGTLLDLVNLAKSDPISGQTTLDESIAMFFTVELLRTVEEMHNVGILHGDLKADNCLVRLTTLALGEDEWSAQYQSDGSCGWSSKGMTLIDFGRSIDMTCFRSDIQFIADWNTGKQDCIEMRELRPWTYQVDYYGIAGVVHSLLFGKYIEDAVVEVKDRSGQFSELGERKRYRIREGLKRYWQTELWTRLFDLTLNPLFHILEEENRRMPCTRALNGIRLDMEGWLMGEGGKRSGGLKNSLLRLEGRIKERRGR